MRNKTTVTKDMQNLSATSRQLVAACRNMAAGNGRHPLLTALSGGPDSVALLKAMVMGGVDIEAAHCNFHLRGEESMRDQRFAERICAELGVELHTLDVDVDKEALEGESTEMTCRRVRYDWFRRLRADRSFHRIATGHNADDNIETLFLNLLRGSGLQGLKAMVADTGEILRPLLRFSRRQIMLFLQETDTPYITDSTNLGSDYRRNFLRNEVLPLIESRWEGMRTAVGRTIELLQSDDRLLKGILNDILGDNPRLLGWETINGFAEPETLIFRYLQPYGGSRYVAEEVARSLPRPHSGRHWRLSEGCRAIATRLGLEICFDSDEAGQKATGTSTANEMQFEWQQADASEIDLDRIRSENDNTAAWLPYPPGHYELRAVPPQARIHPIGMRGSQAVANVLREAGLSVDERKHMKLLVDKTSGKVIWIPGVKRSRHHLLDGTETNVWCIRLKRKKTSR